MGMCLGLATLSDANIERVLRDPPLVWCVVAPDDPEPFEEARAARQKPTLWSLLFGRRRQAAAAGGLELRPPEGAGTDLDKAWHGIHYLLTGTASAGDPPLDFLVAGGRAVGDIDVGYGPARVFTREQTRSACDALRAVTDEDLRARFDPADMLAKEIYPEIWDRAPEHDDTLGYLIENVQTLRRFLEQAVAQDLGMVVYLT
ncbi:MAG TPA: YfbM family protein [Planctomycetota bacterium]|nr:YfbM family protein [Planctomycetota bacterium]